MDHVAAAEVDRPVVREVAAAPDEERIDRVHARSPQDDERDPCFEVHAAEDGAEHEDRRDPGEDELEVDERGLREVRLPDEGNVPLPLQRLVVEHVSGLADEVPEEARVRQAVPRIAEAHLVPVEHPLDEHEGERDEGEHHRVHRPALLHHAAVQDDETGDAHQPDERRCRELPGVVARVQPLRVQHRPLPSLGPTKKPQDSTSPEATLPPRGLLCRPREQEDTPRFGRIGGRNRSTSATAGRTVARWRSSSARLARPARRSRT